MKIIIYDATQKGALGLVWRVGAWLYKKLGWADEVVAIRSTFPFWSDLSYAARGRFVDEIQFWGHGEPGGAFIAGNPLCIDCTDLFYSTIACLHADSVFWFRTCSTFASADGQAFAKEWTDALGCRVAGHTYKIGFWHSGLHTLAPGEEPDWCEAEGTMPEPGKIHSTATGRVAKISGPLEPRTRGFWARSIW